MNLRQLQKTWNELGKKDPLWAVLTCFAKQNRKWSTQDFFSTGEKEIKEVMKQIKSLNKKMNMEKALDFGCGVGRLTQPLATYFNAVYGVDIAESMIETANKYNKKGNKCIFIVNKRDNLSIFKDNYFDFIYSNITLQHMKPNYAKNYIKEFLRLLSPNGMLVFQLPSTPANTPKGLLIRVLPKRILNILRKNIEMYSVNKEEILQLLNRHNSSLVAIYTNQFAGGGWISYTYFISKNR